jgi:hypothetical protein
MRRGSGDLTTLPPPANLHPKADISWARPIVIMPDCVYLQGAKKE